jgi:hypothetical protein
MYLAGDFALAHLGCRLRTPHTRDAKRWDFKGQASGFESNRIWDYAGHAGWRESTMRLPP